MATKHGVLSQDLDTVPTHKRGMITELIEQGALADVKLKEFIRRVSNKMNNKYGEKIEIKTAPLKTQDSAGRKVGIMNWNDPNMDTAGEKTPYEVKDIARATIRFSTIPQMYAVKDFIASQPEFTRIEHFNENNNVLKDRWAEASTGEYKDIKFFLSVPITHNNRNIQHIVELQLNTTSMDRGKKFGHAFYNVIRLGKGPAGSNKWEPNKKGSVIRIPANKKAEIANKLRTAIIKCKSMVGKNDEEIKWAIKVMVQFLNNKFVYDESLDSYKEGTQELSIMGGKYNWPQDSAINDAAYSWALAKLAAYVFSCYTYYSEHQMSRPAHRMHEQ